MLTLAWTLLRQGPAGRPAARRLVVAVPSSLVSNWQAEARKWLGEERLRTVALRSGKDADAHVAAFVCVVWEGFWGGGGLVGREGRQKMRLTSLIFRRRLHASDMDHPTTPPPPPPDTER